MLGFGAQLTACRASPYSLDNPNEMQFVASHDVGGYSKGAATVLRVEADVPTRRHEWFGPLGLARNLGDPEADKHAHIICHGATTSQATRPSLFWVSTDSTTLAVQQPIVDDNWGSSDVNRRTIQSTSEGQGTPSKRIKLLEDVLGAGVRSAFAACDINNDNVTDLIVAQGDKLSLIALTPEFDVLWSRTRAPDTRGPGCKIQNIACLNRWHGPRGARSGKQEVARQRFLAISCAVDLGAFPGSVTIHSMAEDTAVLEYVGTILANGAVPDFGAALSNKFGESIAHAGFICGESSMADLLIGDSAAADGRGAVYLACLSLTTRPDRRYTFQYTLHDLGVCRRDSENCTFRDEANNVMRNASSIGTALSEPIGINSTGHSRVTFAVKSDGTTVVTEPTPTIAMGLVRLVTAELVQPSSVGRLQQDAVGARHALGIELTFAPYGGIRRDAVSQIASLNSSVEVLWRNRTQDFTPSGFVDGPVLEYLHTTWAPPQGTSCTLMIMWCSGLSDTDQYTAFPVFG